MRLTFGPFVFDSRLRSVTRNGEKVGLSPKAFLLLEALIEARPAPVTRELLYERLWPKTFVEPGNLHNLIAEIRDALADDRHELVRTSRGLGYSFDARDLRPAATSVSRFLLWIGAEAISLGLGESIIGRDPECSVIIDSPDVSRQHARIFVSDDHIVLEDIGSRNGTFVGGERLVTPRILYGGEDVVIGKTAVLLRKRGSIKSTATGPPRPLRQS